MLDAIFPTITKFVSILVLIPGIILELVLVLIIPPSFNTTYAPGFSRDKFETIVPGITKTDVETLIGDPILSSDEERYGGDPKKYNCWRYSKGGRLPRPLRVSYEFVRVCFDGDVVRWRGSTVF